MKILGSMVQFHSRIFCQYRDYNSRVEYTFDKCKVGGSSLPSLILELRMFLRVFKQKEIYFLLNIKINYNDLGIKYFWAD